MHYDNRWNIWPAPALIFLTLKTIALFSILNSPLALFNAFCQICLTWVINFSSPAITHLCYLLMFILHIISPSLNHATRQPWHFHHLDILFWSLGLLAFFRILSILSFIFFKFTYVFSDLYIQHWVRTHDPKVKSYTFHQLSQSGAFLRGLSFWSFL